MSQSVLDERCHVDLSYLNDDSDDDDELLRPVFSQNSRADRDVPPSSQSSPSQSSQSQSQSQSPSPAKSTTTTNGSDHGDGVAKEGGENAEVNEDLTPAALLSSHQDEDGGNEDASKQQTVDSELLLRKAEEHAKKLVDENKDLTERLASINDVVWCRDRKSYYPAVLPPSAERNAPVMLSQTQSNEKKVPILFMGRFWSKSWTTGVYPRSSLKPFDYDPKLSSSSSRSTKPNDGISSRDDNATTRVWNHQLMKKYLKLLSKQAKFQSETGKYDLLVEEAYLKYALMKIHENQQATLEPKLPRSITDDDDNNKDLGDGGVEEGETLAASATTNHERAPHETTTRSQSSTSGASASAPGVYHSSKPSFKLRAGDVIQYIIPGRTAESKHRRHAVVMMVHGKKDDIALALSDGTLLPPDHMIAVIHRWLRHRWEESVDKRYYYIDQFTLDSSRNGEVHIKTLADHLSAFMDQVKTDILATAQEASAGTSHAHHDNSHKNKKRSIDDMKGENVDTSNNHPHNQKADDSEALSNHHQEEDPPPQRPTRRTRRESVA